MRQKKSFKHQTRGHASLLVCIVAWLLCLAYAPPAWAIGGSGTSSSPFTIANSADMEEFKARIEGNTYNSGYYYKLTASFTWTAFNGDGVGRYANPFRGNFDGDGYTITLPSTHLQKDINYIGFFDRTENATIKNLKLLCGYNDGREFTAAFIGEAVDNLTLENVHVEQSGTSVHSYIASAGFIGKFYKGSGAPVVNITNCSYINTGTLTFTYNNAGADAGGFVGRIDEGYASVTFTDCFVYLNKVDLNTNTSPFGCFIGATHNNVTMIRCVQGSNLSIIDESKNRATIAGWIKGGKTITGYASYSYKGGYYKGISGSSTGSLIGFTTQNTWGDYEYEHTRLERKNNSGAEMSSGTRGNERWGVDNSQYPKLTNTNYAIKISRGTGISAISGTGYNASSTNNHYRAANTAMTITPTSAPNSHQRIVYSFSPAYNHSAYNSSSNPNYTASTSGANWSLSSKVDGTVSAVIQDIPYPWTNSSGKANNINTVFDQWTSKVTLSWSYDNPSALTGKFYVYKRDVTAAGAYTLITSPAAQSAVSGSARTMTCAVPLSASDFGKNFDYLVGFYEGSNAPSDYSDISTNERAIVSVNTTPTLSSWSVEAVGATSSVDVSFTPDSRFFGSSYTYKIQRSVNGNPFADWVTSQNFPASETVLMHTDNEPSSQCDVYQYKVIISAFNTTFEKSSNIATVSGSTQFIDADAFKATKGEHAGYVRLQWKVNKIAGGSTETFRVFRQLASANPETGVWDELETVTSNAATVYWNDNNALTGIFYRYKVILYQVCTGTETYLAEKTDIGFTQAFGVVSGRVTYGAGGNAVKEVNVLARKTDLMEGEKQYHSLKSTGGGQKFEYLADQTWFNNIWTAKNWTLQFWVRPDGTNTGAAIIGYIGGNAVSMQAVTGGYQIYTALGTTYKSEIILANKFTHIAITRNGNDVKIYTVCDEAPNDISIKNTPFTYSTATSQTAANSKISFGHGLKGNVDEVRLWNKALTEAEILRDYSRMLVGNESGLQGYWTFDEGLNGYAFDRSRVGTVYNNFHATTVTLESDATVPDETYQLALKGITDQNGNYQISGIPYSGEGTSYSIVPSFGEHAFNPTEQLRYVSPTSMVHNATDFTDISAFMVRGRVVYEGGNYPVSDCSFEIDGQPVMMSGGTVVKSDNDGNFEISVPIGSHAVRVVKTGHTFASEGYLKDANGADMNYNAPVANVKFEDQTKVKLIGRVVGSNAEDSKPLAFGESKNNIGVETIVLNSTRQQYDFSTTPVSETYTHNNGQWHKANGLADDQTVVDYNQKNLTVHVSPVTGEFSAMVYPESYDIQPISVTQGSGQPVLIVKENAENINLTTAAAPDDSYLQTEIRTWTDSTFVANRPGVVDHWEYSEKSDTVRYNAKWTYKYQTTPTFGVKQLTEGAEVNYFGEKTFEVKDELLGATETLTLYDEGTDTYLFVNPVFQQGKKYDLRFNAYEEYTNFVSDPAVKETYPISNGTVNINNNLQVTAEPESLEMDNDGILDYRFTAGAPNLTTASSDIFATLTLGAVSYYWNMLATGLVADNMSPLEAWQLGEKTTGTNFMTSGPDQLTVILRDPPGTASYAYIEKGTSVSSNSQTSIGGTITEELNLTVSLGPKITTFIGLGAGVITETEVKADVLAGLTVEESYSSETEHATTSTFTERFQTSDSPDYVGAMGDVFIGNSTNILYGLTNGVKIQKGVVAGTTYSTQGEYKLASSAAIAYGQEFSTRFAYTEMELENIMIPKWENSIANRLLPVGTSVNPASISAPVYVSKLQQTDENYGKWNLDDVFRTNPAFDLLKPYDGASYTIYFPTSWTPTSEPMENFQDSVLWANNQIDTWVTVLAQNEKEKVEMTHKGNYSFGGGAQIEYSEATTASTSYTHNFGFNMTPSLGAVVGGEVMGIGLELETKVSIAVEQSSSTGGSTETSKTTGFVLAEEGNVDEITVDYGTTASGTFAFKTRGGQTSCPYEGERLTRYYQPGQHVLQEATMRIEAPVINVSSAAQVLNVPANRTATFTLALENESEINEDVWFQLIVDEETNPNGAELKIDGIGIGNGRTFLVKAGETLTKTLTIGKGTVDDYDNIGLILRSLCQEEIADTTWVTAHFVPACSDVVIAQPANNFIVNTESPNGNVLSVTLQGFDVNFPNFGYIRFEYRPVTSPIWLTARTFYPSNLFASPTNTDGTKEDIGTRAAIVYDWTMPSADGQYELRATAASVNIVNDEIVGNPLSTYTTAAITGYKDMVKPQALGLPSPANGIYGAGDELSVTFNEEINTSMIISDNIVVTYGANIPVPITYVASANKITMEYPSDYFSILEEQTLDITVTDIYDMRGNKSEPVSWSAYVNRNALVWDTEDVNLVKEAGATLQFTARIKNAGNQTVNYSIVNLPSWLSVNAPTGNLQPLASNELTFSISGGVNLGVHTEQIGLTSGNSIIKNLLLNLNVTGALPNGWSVNPADYESTMTVTGSIQIEGAPQEDEADLLAAFIGEECVGVVSPRYVSTSNTYMTFMTVYGNSAHAGKDITFKLWDASTGYIYSSLEYIKNSAVATVAFGSLKIEGTIASPIIHNALNIVEQNIPLVNGWSWISVNVENTNPTLINQFKTNISDAGLQLKGNAGYIDYSNSQWAGSLTAIDNTDMYSVKTSRAHDLKMNGRPLNPAATPLTLTQGWSWIGYTPQFTLPTNSALAEINAQVGDQIKDHDSYRMYSGANGWIGNLDYMRAGKGYMYYSGNGAAQTFTYPSTSNQHYNAPALRNGSENESHWTTDRSRFANTMTVTSIVLDNNTVLNSDQLEIGAFSGNDCRGSIRLQEVEGFDNPYLGFLMVFGEAGDEIHFKVYDHATASEYAATASVDRFVTDGIYGNPANPERIALNVTGIHDVSANALTIYPNPVKNQLYIRHNFSQLDKVEVVDISGRILILKDRNSLSEGESLDVSHLSKGMYLLKVTADYEITVVKFNKK